MISPIHGIYRTTQLFGENPEYYAQFGLKGHAGIDLAGESPGDTPKLYSPILGTISTVGYDVGGFGNYVKIIDATQEITLAHLEEIYVDYGDIVDTSTLIGVLGSTGNTMGAHVHIRKRELKNGKIQNLDNGYRGAVNFEIEPYNNDAKEVEERNERYMSKFGITENSMDEPISKRNVITMLSKEYYEDNKTV